MRRLSSDVALRRRSGSRLRRRSSPRRRSSDHAAAAAASGSRDPSFRDDERQTRTRKVSLDTSPQESPHGARAEGPSPGGLRGSLKHTNDGVSASVPATRRSSEELQSAMRPSKCSVAEPVTIASLQQKQKDAQAPAGKLKFTIFCTMARCFLPVSSVRASFLGFPINCTLLHAEEKAGAFP